MKLKWELPHASFCTECQKKSNRWVPYGQRRALAAHKSIKVYANEQEIQSNSGFDWFYFIPSFTLCHKTLIQGQDYFILSGHSVTCPRPETAVSKIIHLANSHDTKCWHRPTRSFRKTNLSKPYTVQFPTISKWVNLSVNHCFVLSLALMYSGTLSLLENAADYFETEETDSIRAWGGGSILSRLQSMHHII